MPTPMKTVSMMRAATKLMAEVGVPPLDDGVHGGGGADVGDDEDGLGERAPQDAGVLPGAGDVVAVEQRRVEPDLGGDRGDVGDDEQPADDGGCASHRVRGRLTARRCGVCWVVVM